MKRTDTTEDNYLTLRGFTKGTWTSVWKDLLDAHGKGEKTINPQSIRLAIKNDAKVDEYFLVKRDGEDDVLRQYNKRTTSVMEVLVRENQSQLIIDAFGNAMGIENAFFCLEIGGKYHDHELIKWALDHINPNEWRAWKQQKEATGSVQWSQGWQMAGPAAKEDIEITVHMIVSHFNKTKKAEDLKCISGELIQSSLHDGQLYAAKALLTSELPYDGAEVLEIMVDARCGWLFDDAVNIIKERYPHRFSVWKGRLPKQITSALEEVIEYNENGPSKEKKITDKSFLIKLFEIAKKEEVKLPTLHWAICMKAAQIKGLGGFNGFRRTDKKTAWLTKFIETEITKPAHQSWARVKEKEKYLDFILGSIKNSFHKDKVEEFKREWLMDGLIHTSEIKMDKPIEKPKRKVL